MPPSSISLLYQHKRLLVRVTRNELSARYAGSLLGAGWAVVYPVLFLAVYTFVYSSVFKVQVPNMSTLQYILYIFAGLVPILVTSESIATGVGAVINNKSILSNTVFPIDLTPPKAVLLSQITSVAGFALIIATSALIGQLSWTVCLLPLVLVLHITALIGITWVLSLVTVLVRDLQVLIGLILMMITIASPVAYTPDMVPEGLKIVLFINPFAHFVIAYQKLAVLGQLPTAAEWAFLVVFSTVLFVGGGLFFTRVKLALVDHV